MKSELRSFDIESHLAMRTRWHSRLLRSILLSNNSFSWLLFFQSTLFIRTSVYPFRLRPTMNNMRVKSEDKQIEKRIRKWGKDEQRTWYDQSLKLDILRFLDCSCFHRSTIVKNERTEKKLKLLWQEKKINLQNGKLMKNKLSVIHLVNGKAEQSKNELKWTAH